MYSLKFNSYSKVHIMLKNKKSITLFLSAFIFTHLNLQAMEMKEEEQEEYMDHSPARILPIEIIGMVLFQNIKLSNSFGRWYLYHKMFSIFR